MPTAPQPTQTTSAFLVDIPSMAYDRALALQRAVVAARIAGELKRDVVIMLEHPPVFTLGRRGGLDNLGVSRRFLEQRGITLVQVERGGDITYHGPGQLVIYPIMNIQGARLGVQRFVAGLEEVMVRTASHWGVTAEGDDQKRGAWIGRAKLGSIGITIRRGISFHGLALNVNTDLTPFGWINPCGFSDITTTSLAQQLGREVSMTRVRKSAAKNLADIFGLRFEVLPLNDLEACLGSLSPEVVK